MLPEKYHHDGGVDEQQSFNHDECGDTKGRLNVRRTARGYIHHCYHCAPAMSGFTHTDTGLSPSMLRSVMRQRAKAEERRSDPSTVWLPDDYTKELSIRHRLWLNRWINDEEISLHSIGTGFNNSRIVFPVFDGEGGTLYWQARSLDTKPKYINPRVSAKNIFFSVGDPYSDRVCLVESILSAIVIGRTQYCVALLGSYLSDDMFKILRSYDKISMWLDPDKKPENIKAARRLIQATGKPVYPIITDRKPKEYQDGGLVKEILSVGNN